MITRNTNPTSFVSNESSKRNDASSTVESVSFSRIIKRRDKSPNKTAKGSAIEEIYTTASTFIGSTRNTSDNKIAIVL